MQLLRLKIEIAGLNALSGGCEARDSPTVTVAGYSIARWQVERCACFDASIVVVNERVSRQVTDVETVSGGSTNRVPRKLRCKCC